MVILLGVFCVFFEGFLLNLDLIFCKLLAVCFSLLRSSQ